MALASRAGATPEVLYERQWSTGLLRRVMVRLAEVYEGEGKADTFRALQPMIAGGQERGRYGELAAELKMSEASLRMMVFRMRKRYRPSCTMRSPRRSSIRPRSMTRSTTS